jgi:glycosyltransferase involved in cell wall biosynthesis
LRTVAVIPAFNEETTIGAVINAASRAEHVEEVVVVSDGSSDRTVEVAEQAGATVVDLGTNRGKGAALQAGLDSTQSDVIVFLDADLIGLTPEHVEALLAPVLEGTVEMTVGIFGKGRIVTDMAQRVAPHLSGQRAIRRELLQQLPQLDQLGFGVEVALTRFVKSNAIAWQGVVLTGVSQVMKEEKFGLVDGVSRRMRMYWEIVRTLAQ